MCRGCGKVVKSGWQVVRPMDVFVSQLLKEKQRIQKVISSWLFLSTPSDIKLVCLYSTSIFFCYFLYRSGLYSSIHLLATHLSGVFNSCLLFPETKRHSSLFLHRSSSTFPVIMAACTPSIHIFLARPLLLLSRGIQSTINLRNLSSAILLTRHTIEVFSALQYLWCLASLSLPLFPLYVHFLFFPSLIYLLTSLAHPLLWKKLYLFLW